MRRGMRSLVLIVTATLLFGGCGTALYEITDEEEDLIVQGAAYLLSKHNIYQKDGVNGTLPEKKDSGEADESGDTESTEGRVPQGGGTSGSGSGTLSQGEGMSLAESIGYEDRLEVSYDGFSLMDVYREENYFSMRAEAGETFVVMRFTIRNPGAEDVEVSNFDAGREFFLNCEVADHVPEKQSIIADSLSVFEGTIPAGGSAGAVLIFGIRKADAELVVTPKLMMEYENTAYSVSL